MSIEDLIKELDSNLIVDDIEKKKIADLVKMMYEAAIEWERRGYVCCSRPIISRPIWCNKYTILGDFYG